MQEDFSELIEYLDGKFIKVNEDLSVVKLKVSNIEESLTGVKLQVSNIEESLKEKADKTDINNLMNSVDAYAHKADTYFQEMAMLTLKVSRHEKWLEKMAEKLGMKLDY